jgi:hypothetical protein
MKKARRSEVRIDGRVEREVAGEAILEVHA